MVVQSETISFYNGPNRVKSSPKIINVQEINQAVYDYKNEYLCLSMKANPETIAVYAVDSDYLKKQVPLYKVKLESLDPENGLPLPISAFNTKCMQELYVHHLNNPEYTRYIDLIDLYNQPYIIYIDSLIGTLKLYVVSKTNDTEPITYKLLQDSNFNINIVDNLIILHYLIDKISIVIDILKETRTYFGLPFCMERQANISDSVSLLSDSDNKTVLSGGLMKDDSRNIYDAKNYMLGYNYGLNAIDETIFHVDINFKGVVQSSEGHVEIFKFLLRREKGKIHAKNYILRCFKSKIELSTFSAIFNKIVANHGLHLSEKAAFEKHFSLKYNLSTLKNKEHFFTSNEIANLISKFKAIRDKEPAAYKQYYCDLLTVIQLRTIGEVKRECCGYPRDILRISNF